MHPPPLVHPWRILFDPKRRRVLQGGRAASYHITRKTAHPSGRISEPILSKNTGHTTSKYDGVGKRSRRGLSIGASLGVCLKSLSPLATKPALKSALVGRCVILRVTWHTLSNRAERETAACRPWLGQKRVETYLISRSYLL